jgi:hypothetical protein
MAPADLPEQMALFSVAGLSVRVLPDGSGTIQGGGLASVVAGAFTGLTAGVTTLVVLRWDLDEGRFTGGRHFALTVDNVTHRQSTTAAALAGAEVVIGARDAAGDRPAFADISGFTLYRRVLGGGGEAGGIGGRDEIALIRNGGIFRDPVRVTGSWDVVLAVPTDMSGEGPLPPSGQAWTHPHGNNLLGANGLLDTVDSWAPTFGASFFAPPVDELVFGFGRTLLRDNPADQVAIPIPLGTTSVVVRALAHAGTGGAPAMALLQTSGQKLVSSVTGTVSSTRDSPDELFLAAQLPPASDHELALGSSTPGDTTWHVIDVQTNLFTDPSFEGYVDGGPPPAWGVEPVYDGGVPGVVERTETHSGEAALRLSASAAAFTVQEPPLGDDPANDGFYAVGGALFQDVSDCAAAVYASNSRFFRHARLPAHPGGKVFRTVEAPSSWQHVSTVARRVFYDLPDTTTFNANSDAVRLGCGSANSQTDIVVDDAYVFPLQAVEIAPTAIDEVGSTSLGLLRVDIGDEATQALVDSPASGGSLYVTGVVGLPGQGFATCAHETTILEVSSADPGSWILLSLDASGTRVFVDGEANGEGFSFETFSPQLFGEPRELTIIWTTTELTILSDGSGVTSGLPQPFGDAFDQVRFGSRTDGTGRCDVSVLLPGVSEQ